MDVFRRSFCSHDDHCAQRHTPISLHHHAAPHGLVPSLQREIKKAQIKVAKWEMDPSFTVDYILQSRTFAKNPLNEAQEHHCPRLMDFQLLGFLIFYAIVLPRPGTMLMWIGSDLRKRISATCLIIISILLSSWHHWFYHPPAQSRFPRARTVNYSSLVVLGVVFL